MGNKIILKGAIILTITGFITRIIGFFYRIFLSQTFGEESVGIYQLIFPVFALGYSLTCAGIETALARTVANYSAQSKKALCRSVLFVGCSISILLSVICMLYLQKYSAFIAENFLNEPRCEDLLLILSYTFPLSSLHSCICGYFLGLKEAKIPAISQLIEQLIRVLTVFLLYKISLDSTNISIAVIGLLFGEFASSVFCFFLYRKSVFHTKNDYSIRNLFQMTRELFSLSLPLTGNRALLNILQSIEAVSIPLKLQYFGYNSPQSLSIYGVLTGMALPCILFPSALTNSIASMMLPTVAEYQSKNSSQLLTAIIKKVLLCCFILGILCGLFFIICGSFIGNIIFHSTLSGQFIMTLAWMCPFLYCNGNLISIINGLGHTTHTLFINCIGLTLRILSVFYLIPFCGIRGYLTGLLFSQISIFLLCVIYLRKMFSSSPQVNSQ